MDAPRASQLRASKDGRRKRPRHWAAHEGLTRNLVPPASVQWLAERAAARRGRPVFGRSELTSTDRSTYERRQSRAEEGAALGLVCSRIPRNIRAQGAAGRKADVRRCSTLRENAGRELFPPPNALAAIVSDVPGTMLDLSRKLSDPPPYASATRSLSVEAGLSATVDQRCRPPTPAILEAKAHMDVSPRARRYSRGGYEDERHERFPPRDDRRRYPDSPDDGKSHGNGTAGMVQARALIHYPCRSAREAPPVHLTARERRSTSRSS